MSILRGVFLAFAIWGLIDPFLATGSFSATFVNAPMAFANAWISGLPLAPLQLEIMVACIVVTIWAFAETYVRKNWIALVGLIVLWAVGLAAGLPLYLFLRTIPPR